MIFSATKSVIRQDYVLWMCQNYEQRGKMGDKDKRYLIGRMRRKIFNIDVRRQLAASIYTACKTGSLCVAKVPGRRPAEEAVRAVQK